MIRLILLGSVLALTGCRCGQIDQGGANDASDSGITQRATCPADADIDPPEDELTPSAQVARQRGFPTSLGYFRDLAQRYPRSARARLRAASAAHHARPRPLLDEALRLYRQALDLHDRGCRLTEEDEWLAFEGLGLIHLATEEPSEALSWFQRGASRWPSIPQTQYNLACTHCLLGQVDPCHAAFVRALETAEAGQAPEFVSTPGRLDYFVRNSRRDPDLTPLRADPRYQAALERFQDAESAP